MKESGGGIGLAGVLFVVFLVLKLIGVITWPWIWVFAPLWIPLVLAVVGLVVFFLVVIVIKALE